MRAIRTARLLPAAILLAGGGVAAAGAPVAHCYRTLADVVCYLAPDPGRERRWVGSYGPVPAAALPPAARRIACPPAARAGPRDLRGNERPQPPGCSDPDTSP